MFAWMLSWFPYLNFSTFILINTIVILVNATTIFVIKSRGIKLWFRRDNNSNERLPARNHLHYTKRKPSVTTKRRNKPRRKSTATDQKVPKQDLVEQWGCKSIRNEGDESINTTLDEITWMSSVDEGEASCREGKPATGGTRLHRPPQSKLKRVISCSNSSGAVKQPRRQVPPLESKIEDSMKPQDESLDVIERNSRHIFCTFHPFQERPISSDIQSTPTHTAEKSWSPQGKNLSKSDRHPVYPAPQSWLQGEPCEKSPKEKPPTSKSHQSSCCSSNVTNIKCDLCAAGEYKSLSSEHQIGSNKSELSTNLNRDSWIWFTTQFPPITGNFAARQDTFRSTDPRVPKLLAEITRQDKMNEDIKRQANSLIISEPTKCIPREEIRGICQVDDYENNVPMCPLMRTREIPYKDKSPQTVDTRINATNKNALTKQNRKSNDNLLSPPCAMNSPPSKYESRQTAGRLQQGMSEYKPRVQFISPKLPVTSRRKTCDISPQNFSSIKYSHHDVKQDYSYRYALRSKREDAGHPERYIQHRAVDSVGRCTTSAQYTESSPSGAFQPISKRMSPDRPRPSPPMHCDLKGHKSHHDRKYLARGDTHEATHIQGKEDSMELHQSAVVQSREESESESLFPLSTSLETYGERVNQIGQEVSRVIKNIIFDSHSSTSNSRIGSSLKSKSPENNIDTQGTEWTFRNRKRKAEMPSPRSPVVKQRKSDDKTPSPALYNRTPRVKGKQKYVFSTNYYLSTRSQSQFRLSSSKSCTSNNSGYKLARGSVKKTEESKSAFLLHFPSLQSQKGKTSPNRLAFGRNNMKPTSSQ